MFRKGIQATNDIFMTNTENKHGQCIEIQNLLFANSHCDDFVKFYFGRIGAKGKDNFKIANDKRICIDAGAMLIIDNKTDEAITRFSY